MTRIIAGRAGGRRLATPPGEQTRPTSDRVREALFSILQARGAVAGARVLDLFAGSGALGLEAASRGARAVTLVDSSRQAVAVARRNVVTVATGTGDPAPRIEVVLSTALRFLQRPDGPGPTLAAASDDPGWDLVLLDPPYALDEQELAAHLDALAGRLAPGALVVVERSSRSPGPRWPVGLVPDADRRYGETRLWIAVAAGR